MLTKGQEPLKRQGLATKDGLTGLINHRTLHEQLRTEKLRAERQKINIGVMMMDIDHFKSVNDTYGHPAGDEVIKVLLLPYEKKFDQK